ncbi:hypothetical protein LNP74_32010 [Klebsiella pneumoniae subsp. pneumoniae]|nr:hypothetical protein [Klebsiella pneumoniae subsp. pneumoniae]
MTLVITTGGIDLVGGGLPHWRWSARLRYRALNSWGLPWPVVPSRRLGRQERIAGAINGFFIAGEGIPALVVTRSPPAAEVRGIALLDAQGYLDSGAG